MDDFSFIQHWICNANTVSNEKLSVKKKKKNIWILQVMGLTIKKLTPPYHFILSPDPSL